MTSNHSRTRFGALTLLILLMAFAAGTGGSFRASAQSGSAGPLTNLGFESGTAGWTGWDLAPDTATVVPADGKLNESSADFAAYAGTPDGDIVVTPNMGTKMARLGTPKAISSSQPDGNNSISQTFRPSSSTLSFAARLFSWESRQNTDKVEFSFTGANTSLIKFSKVEFITTANKVAASCAGGSNVCSSWIDVGNRGDYLSSLGSNPVDGWVTITVTGLPTDADVTFKASVGSTQNNALASWLYLDSANTPPVADFDFSYPTVSLSGGVNSTDRTGPLEGSPIQFADKSSDPDPGDQIVSWKWEITKNGLSVLNAPLNAQNPYFVPNDDGDYSIKLTVTDSGGLTGTITKVIQVLNAPPLVNALNVEAIAGKPFPVTGRFTDAGWDDKHTATWTGPTVTATSLAEDHAPAIGTGKATGSATVSAATSGVFRVTDAADGSSLHEDPFSVTMVTAEGVDGHTGFDTARPVTVDGSYLGRVSAAGSRSVYEIKWPGTGSNGDQELPGGSEILVNLKDLPADYDLILVTTGGQQSTSGYAFSGYAFSGFAFSGYAFSDLPNLVSPYSAGYAFSGTGTAGYAFSGIQRAAYGEAGYAFSDASAAGYAFSGYAFSGYAFSGYAFSDAGGYGSTAFAPYAVAGYAFSPISQMGFTGLDSSNASPSDVSLTELGLGQIPAGASVVGYSANRGKDGETVLARIDSPGTRLYAIVVGANGAYSPEPFRMDVEGSMTITAAALNAADGSAGKVVLTGGTCAPRTISPVAPSPSVLTSPASPTTLFVTNQARLSALNPTDDWSAFVTSMQALAARSDVNGKIISVESPAFAAWDATPCSIEAANDVSEAVRVAILAELKANASIQYVVILGDDDVIPFRRVPDQVSIGNERSYLSSSFLKQGTPLYASVAGGYNLTDDCNTDFLPTPWQGRELCIPDRVISRLVETPTEIRAQANAFIASNGQLDSTSTQTALVAGYDFFDDGANAVVDALVKYVGLVTTLIRSNWTADDLRCQMLGIGSGCPVAPAISNPNAHFTHYAGLSANGFNTHQYDDVLTSDDVASVSGYPSLAGGSLVGRLIYTIGCHAGFSAPDNAINYDPNLGVDARLDFAQAFAQARAVYVASTGYGIGDDSGIAGTERLMVLFAERLQRGMPAGQALVDAKRYYLSALPAASVYDEKSSINLTFYGLPMYRLPVAPPTTGVEIQALAAEAGSPSSFIVALNTVAQGSYYSVVGGDAAAPPYRPLQPSRVVPVPAGDPVHGILWKSGGFTDYTNFNPVISRPSVEWEQNPTEPQVCYQGFWPSEIFRVNTLDNAAGQLEQTVVVTPGQFRCDLPEGSAPGTEVRGTQRLFNILGWEMLRSTSLDVTPPSLTSFDVDLSGDSLKPVQLKIGAIDPVVGNVGDPGYVPASEITRVVVLRINSITHTVDAISDETFAAVNPLIGYTVNIANPGNDRLVIQMVDGAGNVGVYTAKGPGLRILNVDLGPDLEIGDGQTVNFTANINEAGEPMVGPVTYFWDFGDGSSTQTTVDANTVSHQFPAPATSYTVKVKVMDSNGGIGIDTVLVRNYCYDPAIDEPFLETIPHADFVGCSAKIEGSLMTITLRMAGPVEPGGAFTGTRYTISTSANGGTKNLNYKDGSWTGVKSLKVSVSGNNVVFEFDPKDVGLATDGKTMTWFAETQGGIPGTGGAGSLDRMKDVGTFSFTR